MSRFALYAFLLIGANAATDGEYPDMGDMGIPMARFRRYSNIPLPPSRNSTDSDDQSQEQAAHDSDDTVAQDAADVDGLFDEQQEQREQGEDEQSSESRPQVNPFFSTPMKRVSGTPATRAPGSPMKSPRLTKKAAAQKEDAEEMDDLVKKLPPITID